MARPDLMGSGRRTCDPVWYATLLAFGRAEELISRRVADARLLREMARVAACLRRGSALDLRPPNVGSGRQGSRTLMALGAQQQPLNCTRLRRVGLCDDLADNRRTVIDLPGRAAEMGTDL